MNKRVLVLVVGAAVVAAGVLWYASGQDGASKPSSSASQQAGQGGGNQGRAPAKVEAQECDNLLRLYSGQDLLWSKDAEAFAAMTEAQAIEESHRATTEGINVRVLAGLVPDVTQVEVVSCEGDVARFPVDKLEMARNQERFYLGSNRRGAFKLIELYEGAEHTMMRNVVKVTLKQGGQRRTEPESGSTPPAE